MKIFSFNDFVKINESAVRMPSSMEYWTKKGKNGKNVALYTHDDMDGIFCAIEMKKYLLNKGFNIVKYGILNYSEGWKYTSLDPQLINVVLDFASMPGDERDSLIDFYLDHHGLFTEEEIEKYKKSPVQKKKSNSAYDVLCQALGIPRDGLALDIIEMIDSAKYSDVKVSWQRLLNYDLKDIMKSDPLVIKDKGKDVQIPTKIRMEFAAAFNQFLKRSDTNTILEVIKNCKDASVYSIFNAMKKLYPGNNIITRGYRKGQEKDFIEDSLWRQGEMIKRTKGSSTIKKLYDTYQNFAIDWVKNNKVGSLDGYQLIGDLVFVPSGTWANALRARTIVEKDFNEGVIPKEPKFILLQYGGTLQVCSYKKLEEYDELPKLKSGKKVDDLGHYMSELLKNFQTHLGYYDPDTKLGQDEITVSGGHGGIGSISNIFGKCKLAAYDGIKYVDMFKNKIISDLSGVSFPLKLVWSDSEEGKMKEPDMDNKVRSSDQLRDIDPKGIISNKK